MRMMVNILDPQEGESIYDPACGTGGMLLGAIEHVQRAGGDPRTFFGKIYGQEKNLTTSSIARMNFVLHGIEDVQIVREDTLRNPAFIDSSTDPDRHIDGVLCDKLQSLEQARETRLQPRPLIAATLEPRRNRVEGCGTGCGPPFPAPLHPTEITLLSSVTLPFRARALPQPMVAPVFRVMLVKARMFPLNAVVVPRVAELPTWKKAPALGPGLSSTTDEADAVVSVLPIWNTKFASG